jgi:hypothetical protein
MKKIIFTTVAILAFGIVSAQQDPQKNQSDAPARVATDTSTAMQNTNQENLKKSDAVKTEGHEKVTPKKKTTAKDTVASKKRRNP